MGLVNAEITLRNPKNPVLAPVKVDALADTGSLHLCIPEHVRIQLELEEIDKKEATLAFKNPKKDVAFYLDLDSPGKELHGPQQVQVNMAGQTIEEFTVQPDAPLLRKMTLPASKMGDMEMAELQIVVDTTFVPSLVNSTSKDKRELGVRVFHAFVDPR